MIKVIETGNKYINLRLTDIRTPKEFQIFTRRYQSILLNIYNESNINAIKYRDLILFGCVYPIIGRQGITCRSIVPKTCIMFDNLVNIPENTEINIRDLYVSEYALAVDLNHYFNYDSESQALLKIQSALSSYKFKIAPGKYTYEEIRENILFVLDFIFSSAFKYLVREEDIGTIEIPPYTTLTLSPYLNKRNMEKLIYMNETLGFTITNEHQMITNVIKTGDLFLNVLLNGEQDESFQLYVEMLNNQKEIEQNRKRYDDKLLKEQNKKSLIKQLIQQKYGNAKIGNKELDIIENEYNIMVEQWKSIIKNKCNHIKLVQSLIKTNNIKIFEQLQPMLEEGDNYICKNCKLPAICSHYYIKFLALQENWKESKTQQMLTKFIAHKVIAGDYYFCNICGDRLMFIDEPMNVTVNSEFRSYIWGSVLNGLDNFTQIIWQNNHSLAQEAVKIILSRKVNTVLDAIIYGYAFVLDVYIGGKNLKSPKAKNVNDVGLILLNSMYNKYYSEVSNYDLDELKNRFIAAYKKIKGINVEYVRDINKDILNDILSSLVFRFAFTVYKLDRRGILQGPEQDFKNVYGMSMQDAIKDIKIKNKNPEITGLVSFKFKDIPQKFEYLIAERKLYYGANIYETKSKGHIFEAYRLYLEFLKINSDSAYQTYINKLNMFNDKNSPNYVVRMSNQTKSIYRQKHVLLSNIYDEDGRKHKWNILFEDGEFKKSDNHHGVIIDYVCEICRVKLSEIEKLDNDKILQLITFNSIRQGFFSYYTDRCPEGEYHEIKNNICTKCGINKLSKDEYYKKYYDKYMNRNKFISPVYPEKIKKVTDWKFNLTPIVHVADLIKKDSQVLLALGPQYYSVHSYLMYCLMAYNQMIYKSPDPFIFVEECREKYEVNGEPIKLELVEPELDKLKYYQQKLAEFILEVSKVSKEFAIDLINYIIKIDKKVIIEEDLELVDEYEEEFDELPEDVEDDIPA